MGGAPIREHAECFLRPRVPAFGMEGGWTWRLPPEECQTPPKSAKEKVGPLRHSWPPSALGGDYKSDAEWPRQRPAARHPCLRGFFFPKNKELAPLWERAL